MFRNQNFEQALTAIKRGLVAARAGWNGKGMFVYFVPPAEYQAQTSVAKFFFGEAAKVPYGGYFALKGADDIVNTWVPSVSDLLAEDWITCQPSDIGDLSHITEVC